MPQIQLDEEIFKVAQRRAADGGYACVEAYIADVVIHGASDDQADNFDHLFTPEVIAQVDRSAAEIDAGGKTYTIDEVREHFEKKRQAWLAKHAS